MAPVRHSERFRTESGKERFFLDRWSLPRRLAERREIVADPALDEHLMKKLEKSAYVWGIESEKYSVADSYSAKERFRAMELGTYHGVSSTLI
jgi:hypothetical protein